MCMVIDIAIHRLSSRCVIRYSLILQSRSIPWSSKLASWLKPNLAVLSQTGCQCLTHWGRDKMNNILQTTFSNVFSSMKMFEFRLKFHWSLFPGGPINNIPALVRIMAWRRSGDKPLSGPMMVSFPTHICVTRPQWVNDWLEQIFLLTSKELSLFYMYIFI